MRSNQLIGKFINILQILNENKFPATGLIMSSPGAGKTSTLEFYSQVKDCNLVTLIASQYSQDDILGIQSVIDGKLTRLNPSWFNDLLEVSKNGKTTILFIDEITTCDEFIQSPLLNLIFNKKLGSTPLPENCFIVAAGNYSEELNGAFSMTAPMANRFQILNLSDSDYSVEEVISNTFDSLNSDDYASFIGLDYCNKPIYDFSKFKDWLRKNISFTPSVITNNREEGLLGFCTVRSLNNSLKFTEEYMKRFNDDDWIRIVGDTLGKFKSGDDWLPIRNRLSDNKRKFMADINQSLKKDFLNSIEEYVNEYKKFKDGTYNYEPDAKVIKEFLNEPDKLTSNDIRIFTKLFAEYPEKSTPGKIFKEFSGKLTSV